MRTQFTFRLFLSLLALLAFSFTEVRATEDAEMNCKKIYILATDVTLAEDGILIIHNGKLLYSSGLHSDAAGLYFKPKETVEAWNCERCYAQNAGSRPKRCKSCGEMNY